MIDVLDRSGDEVVDGHDSVRPREQKVHEVRAEKSSAARDDGSRLRAVRGPFFGGRHGPLYRELARLANPEPSAWRKAVVAQGSRPCRPDGFRARQRAYLAPVPTRTIRTVRQRIF